MIPFVTVPIHASSLTGVINWLIAAINEELAAQAPEDAAPGPAIMPYANEISIVVVTPPSLELAEPPPPSEMPANG